MELVVKKYLGHSETEGDIVIGIPFITGYTSVPRTAVNLTLEEILTGYPNHITGDCTVVTCDENTYTDISNSGLFSSVLQSYFYSESAPLEIVFNDTRKLQISGSSYAYGKLVYYINNVAVYNGVLQPYRDSVALTIPGLADNGSYRFLFKNRDYDIDSSKITADYSSISEFWAGVEEYVEPSDPYEQGGTTGDDETDPEGGDGTFENEEITVDPPALPSLSAIQSGFIAAYMPSYSQLQSLGDYLWSDLFSLDTFKKLFSDPMQAILGLSLVPVSPNTADSNVVIGNINTGISMPKVLRQFVSVDCGSITLPEYWGGYLDYSPYTKVEIYLPYIGVRPLDTDEVMGRTLRVVYNVDVLSGACVCFIQCDNTIRYHYVGQCGASIPITANDWTRVVNGAVSIATALGVGVATLGSAAAASGATAASMAGTGALVGGIASQVLASKPRVEHSGSLAGMGGILGVQFPYVIIQRPRQAVPSGQNAFTGYPSFIRRTLATVSGYTQVTGVHLTNLSCTDEEKKEIQAYLEAGVIL